MNPSLQELAIDRITCLVQKAFETQDEDLRAFLLNEGRHLAESMDHEDFFFCVTYHRFT